MPYPKTKTWEFTLGEMDPDSDDLKISVKEPASLPASTQSYVGRAQAVYLRIQRATAKAQAEKKQAKIAPEDEWALQAPLRLLGDAVVSWNLPYPDDFHKVELRGKVIPLHDPDAEPDPFGVVPNEVYAFILGVVMNRLMMPSKSPQG